MTQTVRATPAAAGHGPRMSDQLGGSIGSEYTHTPARDQEFRFPGAPKFKSRAEIRREQLRQLSDDQVYELHKELGAEIKRRRKNSAEAAHREDPANRVRYWPPCPICRTRTCRDQACRKTEQCIAGTAPCPICYEWACHRDSCRKEKQRQRERRIAEQRIAQGGR
jgi:hypothetical protein